jgi:hypothetical protein
LRYLQHRAIGTHELAQRYRRPVDEPAQLRAIGGWGTSSRDRRSDTGDVAGHGGVDDSIGMILGNADKLVAPLVR